MSDCVKNEKYEHNLKLYNESIRKDLDITLTSIIPTQKNLMKTILWLNSSIIGLSIATLSKDISIGYIIVPFSLSFLAILIILFALKDGRIKAFGTPNIKDIEKIKEDDDEKVMGLIQMNNSYRLAFNNNEKLIKKRANKIACAINTTIGAIISIPILLSIFYIQSNLLKGGSKMAENDNPSSSTRPTMSSATSKPAAMMSTNNSNKVFANDRAISESTISSSKSKSGSSINPSKLQDNKKGK